MKKLINKTYICSLAILLVLCSACQNFFQTSPDDMMLEGDNYKQKTALFSSFVGLAAVFQEVADQTLLLTELRGDMMEPTDRATFEMWKIHRFEIDENNTLVSPHAYYKVILNVNDFIRHVVEVKKANPEIVADNVYKGMISQALTFRNWCYLTIGKIYGEAAWHDLSFWDKTEVSDIRILKFDELLEELIASMHTGVAGVDCFNDLSWSDHVLLNADYSWNRVAVKPNALMAELYLWNKEYQKTIDYAMRVINETTEVDKYKISSVYSNGAWATMIGADIGVSVYEQLTVIPFNSSEKQFSQFQFLLNYAFRPTTSVIDRYNRQDRSDGGSADRYRGKGVTYREFGDELYINKYSIRSSGAAPVFIYRASDVHFMLIEALNHMELHKEAMVFLNTGLAPYWNGTGFMPPMDNPLFPISLQKNIGIRGRVSLKDYVLPILDSKTATAEDKMFAVDSLVAEEVAMESAYEGKRWFTLMRMARNWNKPEILANPVSSKFVGEEEKYKALLMNPDNWFIKVNHTK